MGFFRDALLFMTTGTAMIRRPEGPGIIALLSRPANAVSFLRPVLLLLGITLAILPRLFDFSPGAFFQSPLALTISASAIAIGFIGDFLDGFLARHEPDSKNRSREIGPWLDAESDALAIYFSGIALVFLSLTPQWFAISVLARYIFALPFAMIPPAPEFPSWYRWYSKSAAAFLQMAIAVFWIANLFKVTAVIRLIPAASMLITLGILLSFILELHYRLAGARRSLPATQPGLRRSWIIYYLLPFLLAPWRYRRMRRLYSRFIKPGDLVFDVGAHIGSRIAVFRDLGARVRAFEPQPACVSALSSWFGADEQVQLRRAALGEKSGTATLYGSPAHPTLASIDSDWIDERRREALFDRVDWSNSQKVELTSLKEEIRHNDVPAFVKIDAEGHEVSVLKGNDRRIPALSFEFLPSEPQRGLECIDEIQCLGSYEFNFTGGESMRFRWKKWLGFQEIRDFLDNYPLGKRSGDVYACLID